MRHNPRTRGAEHVQQGENLAQEGVFEVKQRVGVASGMGMQRHVKSRKSHHQNRTR